MPWDFYLEVFRVFFQSSLITFAGQGSLPVLNQEFVQLRHWVTEADVATSLAVGRLSPGPTGMYVVSLGYMVAGWPGAFLAMLGASIPPLLILPIAPLVRRSLHRPWVRGAMQGIGLASAGLLLSVASGILLSTGVEATLAFGGSVALAALGFALSWTGKIHPVAVLGAAGAGGIALSLMGL
ncbi:MAG TPA: chromate transporter [Chloroflexota bacterium]|jgi:chromate transporter|nr:chromate transporter [Chloroflexota bacterium]